MRRFRDESGQAVIFMLLCMTCLLGFVGFAVDIGVLFHAKRVMQIAADSAAVAGAAQLNFGSVGVTAAARAASAQNGVTNGVGSATVAVNNGPLNGPHVANARYVEVIVSQPQQTSFMKVINNALWGSMGVTARAVATNGSSTGCIYTLGTTGTDISIVGNSNLSVPTCGITDNSSSSGALTVSGNATVTAKAIGVVGGYSHTGNVSVTPTPVTGLVPTSDPLSFLSAPTVPSSCGAAVSLAGNATRSITSGCYSGITIGANSTLNLSPGLYVINGSFSVAGNSALNGTGVTLDLLGSTSIAGNAIVNLTAPTSGTYNGVLIYQPASNNSAMSLVGNAGSTFEGIVYAPSATVDFVGNSGSTIYTDFVVKVLNLTGNSSLLDYATINGDSVLSAPRLVE